MECQRDTPIEFGFELTLGNTKQAWHLTSEISKGKIPVLVSLDLPEQKSDKKGSGKINDAGRVAAGRESIGEKRDRKQRSQEKAGPQHGLSCRNGSLVLSERRTFHAQWSTV